MITAFIIAAVIIAIDQISKYYIRATMQVGESFNLIPRILNIRYIENPGASFGILADHRWVFMSLSSIMIVAMFGAIIYLGRKRVARYNRLINTALAFMFGGGIGNMIDRFFNVSEAPGREGVKVVVDFLEFDFVNFAIFNFADVFVTVGAVLLAICTIAGKYKFNENEPGKYEDIIKSAVILARPISEDGGLDIPQVTQNEELRNDEE